MNSTGMSGTVPLIKCEDASPLDGDGPAPAPGGSYNLSVNLNLSAAVSNLLAAETGGNTPRTPEILNSLIAMSNPLEQYNYSDKTADSRLKGGSGNDSNSSMSNGSPATSPASGSPPSIQKTCSELIKAGLKLTIESKRKMSGSDTDTSCVKRMKREDSDDEYDSSTTTTNGAGLTPEDEERRRRRRERNKIAATKCRMKKRERTVNLVTESEVLENTNFDLKSQLKDLELEKRQLMEMLSQHAPSCVKNNQPPAQQFNLIRPYESPTPFPANYDASSPYIRPESANVLPSSYTCITTINGETDPLPSLDGTYMTPQMIDQEYHRPESVLSLATNVDGSYVTTDGYLHNSAKLLVIESGEQEYYEPDVNYHMSNQQCHTYPSTAQDSQVKINNGLNDRCLV